MRFAKRITMLHLKYLLFLWLGSTVLLTKAASFEDDPDFTNEDSTVGVYTNF